MRRVAGALLGRLQRAAGKDERDDLGLRQRRVGEEGHAWLSRVPRTLTPAVMSGNSLTARHVDARVIDRAAGEDQPAALDVELAGVGGVLALGHRQLTGAARDRIVAVAHGDAAGEAAGEPHGIEVTLVAEHQGDVAHNLEALAGLLGSLPTMTSSSEARTALVMSLGAILA